MVKSRNQEIAVSPLTYGDPQPKEQLKIFKVLNYIYAFFIKKYPIK